MTKIEKHFVVFYSPGTFLAETTERPIKSWDVKSAIRMAKTITERYSATPYGFAFVTRGRGPKDLDSREIRRSGVYFLHGKVETLAEIETRALPSERILCQNMKGNGWDRVVTSTKGYRWTQPLGKDDVVLGV